MSPADESTELPPATSLTELEAYKTQGRDSPSADRSIEDNDRNTVFTSLVTEDGDVVGLVAYSIYKQNKHDWLLAFGRLKGRDPTEAESTAYIIGESTPRRLAIYRHLAQATLDGKGPDVSLGGAGNGRSHRNLVSQAGRRTAPAQSNLFARALGYLVVAIVVAVVVIGAVRAGLIPSPK